MKTTLVAFAAILLFAATPAHAHRLDEYLQASTLSIEKDHVTVQMRLTPGVQVSSAVLAGIDTNGDGVISPAEQRAYAERVIDDLSLTVDGTHLQPRLVSSTFPGIEDIKEGLGDILFTLEAPLPDGGQVRKLTFENHHLPTLSVYLVNVLIPNNPDIRITAQNRNYAQSFYELDYTQADSAPRSPPLTTEGSTTRQWFSSDAFWSYFNLGVHHILTGYDHLLFISALVLAATTLWDLIKVVSTFTIAHTLTLMLSAFNIVHLPSWVVEPLISASIVFVAIQNVFWPERARGWSRLGAAFFFGLFHGLGFAGGLLDAMREMPSSTMLLAILAFSLGVEIGHQMVVLPLFAFLRAARRTRADPGARTYLSLAFQRCGSAVIAIAGVYYLCLALTGNS